MPAAAVRKMVHAESERDTARPQFPDRGVLDEGHVFLRDVAHWGCAKVKATLPNCPGM
jgi:hypothetical protein